MKLSRASKKFTTDKTPTKNLKPQIKAAVDHLNETALPGNPYSIANLADELVSARLMTIGRSGSVLLGHVLEELVQRGDWVEFGQWGHFGKKGKTTLRQVIDASSVRGATYDVQGFGTMVESLTTEDAEHGPIRKTLQRLVAAGRFVRVDRGMYQRVAKGL